MKSKTIKNLSALGTGAFAVSAYIKGSLALLTLNTFLGAAGMTDAVIAMLCGLGGLGLWVVVKELEDSW